MICLVCVCPLSCFLSCFMWLSVWRCLHHRVSCVVDCVMHIGQHTPPLGQFQGSSRSGAVACREECKHRGKEQLCTSIFSPQLSICSWHLIYISQRRRRWRRGHGHRSPYHHITPHNVRHIRVEYSIAKLRRAHWYYLCLSCCGRTWMMVRWMDGWIDG